MVHHDYDYFCNCHLTRRFSLIIAGVNKNIFKLEAANFETRTIRSEASSVLWVLLYKVLDESSNNWCLFVNNCVREQLEHFVFIAAVKDIKVNVKDNREYGVFEPYCFSVYLLAFSTVVRLTKTSNMWTAINGKNAVHYTYKFYVSVVYIFL